MRNLIKNETFASASGDRYEASIVQLSPKVFTVSLGKFVSPDTSSVMTEGIEYLTHYNGKKITSLTSATLAYADLLAKYCATIA